MISYAIAIVAGSALDVQEGFAPSLLEANSSTPQPETAGNRNNEANIAREYGLEIRRQAMRSLAFPLNIKNAREIDAVGVKVTVQRDGTISQAVILVSSGDKSFDDAALSSVRATAPLAPFPAEFSKDKLNLLISIGYRKQPSDPIAAKLSKQISEQLKPFWIAPDGKAVENIVTVVQWELRMDGKLAAPPTVVSQMGVTNENKALAKKCAERALKAVAKAAPFKLPRNQFSSWRKITFRFDRKIK